MLRPIFTRIDHRFSAASSDTGSRQNKPPMGAWMPNIIYAFSIGALITARYITSFRRWCARAVNRLAQIMIARQKDGNWWYAKIYFHNNVLIMPYMSSLRCPLITYSAFRCRIIFELQYASHLPACRWECSPSNLCTSQLRIYHASGRCIISTYKTIARYDIFTLHPRQKAIIQISTVPPLKRCSILL